MQSALNEQQKIDPIAISEKLLNKEHKKRDSSLRSGYGDYEMREAWNLIMEEDHKSPERRCWSQ